MITHIGGENVCENCKYWLFSGEPDEGWGECRKYAPRPQPIKINEEGLVAIWPRANRFDACGEFEE